MTENSDYNPMPAYTQNTENLLRRNPELFEIPDSLCELLEQFIERANKDEILMCMRQIINIDKQDYDSVAHIFL